MLKIEYDSIFLFKTKKMEKVNPVKILEYSEFSEFEKEVLSGKIFNYHLITDHIFRGQSSNKFDLLPSIFREDFWKTKKFFGDKKTNQPHLNDEFHYIQKELEVLKKFYKIADIKGLYVPHIDKLKYRLSEDIWDFYGNWLPDDMFELAGIAQHYGVPTRLIDWSFDINIALYFAITNNFYSKSINDKDDSIVLWVLNIDDLKDIQSNVNHRKKPKFNQFELIKPVYHSNRNLFHQKGLFTMWKSTFSNESLNDDDEFIKPFDKQIENYIFREYFSGPLTKSIIEPILYKILLNKSELMSAIQYLSNHGYTGATLFDGYYGVAKKMQEDEFIRGLY